MKYRASFILVLVLLAGILGCRPVTETIPSRTVTVFHDNMIHFAPDDSAHYDTAMVSARDNGRIITTYAEMQRPGYPVRITARLELRPIPKDMRSVHDRWDRAGSVRLLREGLPDVELVRFMTSYGGRTEHFVDVSHLAPLLDGHCVFEGFIDTWVSPAWRMDFELVYEYDMAAGNPDWAAAVLGSTSANAKNLGTEGFQKTVEVPEGMDRVVLNYIISGHCTDGRDADEFISKDNVITVDGVEVWRHRPWRDDCGQFRAINPYCARWSDGSWSSDYSRSGWCPGDVVLPLQIDLTKVLPAGPHVIGINIEDVRPEDDEGHLGYWRVSSHLLGWEARR